MITENCSENSVDYENSVDFGKLRCIEGNIDSLHIFYHIFYNNLALSINLYKYFLL